MNLISLFFIFSFVVSCSPIDLSTEDIPPRGRYANEINFQTAEELEKERRLYCFGTGGAMLTDVKMMHLSFEYRGETTLEEKRELFIYAVEKYLANINSCEGIRPYLANDPFEVKNIGMHMVFVHFDGTEFPKDVISFVSTRDGKINYYSNRNKGYETLELQETFEEAKQKLIDDQTPPKLFKVHPLREFFEHLMSSEKLR